MGVSLSRIAALSPDSELGNQELGSGTWKLGSARLDLHVRLWSATFLHSIHERHEERGHVGDGGRLFLIDKMMNSDATLASLLYLHVARNLKSSEFNQPSKFNSA